MAQPAAMDRLPSELLLHITKYLRASDITHIRNLCLVSKKLLPLAQEVLYANATLPLACSCHPTVNSALQLLRTLLENPSLAKHVKTLRFSVVRRNVGQLYEAEFPKKNFDLVGLQELCSRKLTALGFIEGHPWWASLKNNVESAYAGLLLCVLPNLTNLQYTLKELHRGYGVMDPIPAFFGTTAPPAALGTTLAKTLQELCMTDLSFLRSMTFENLKVLNITSVTVPVLLQLNGPNTFRGTKNLSELTVGMSVFLMDKACISDMTVSFRDLLDALGCHALSKLKIKLEHETYCALHIPPAFDIQVLMDQLSCLKLTLRDLEIDLNPSDEPDEWAFILGHCENPVSSLTHFANMESLRIPQDFLFTTLGDDPQALPHDLPKKLRSLEIVCPNREILAWAKTMLVTPRECRDLHEIILRCRPTVRSSASTFTKKVKPMWPALLDSHGITGYVREFDVQTTQNLVELYSDDPGESDDEEGWEDDDENRDEDDVDGNENSDQDPGNESDEEMPDLEPFQDAIGMIIDDLGL
ncbi:hypothetical protein BU23DRAFT_96019 [Bimuria novae-zelandiae CBS 107.79]|uniref:F-box domain-containing protein n=1 Tax=Bimuria novae-zelandiae CBS 107.79 TaxID=1447943 RepID=A0A6A5VMI6_9PLEO|nr:hypothetical protein BU23DRAFT_96019 [Bimuria novae-zelandiae CBS 107.79]